MSENEKLHKRVDVVVGASLCEYKSRRLLSSSLFVVGQSKRRKVRMNSLSLVLICVLLLAVDSRKIPRIPRDNDLELKLVHVVSHACDKISIGNCELCN